MFDWIGNILGRGLAKGLLFITLTNTVWHAALCSDFHWLTTLYPRIQAFPIVLYSWISEVFYYYKCAERKPDNKKQ